MRGLIAGAVAIMLPLTAFAVENPSITFGNDDSSINKFSGFTTLELREVCGVKPTTKVEYVATGLCLGFLGGALPSTKSCPPKGVTLSQAVNVFNKWADSHPEKQHLPSYTGLGIAFRKAFPCRSEE
jgi:hypothetical protein